MTISTGEPVVYAPADTPTEIMYALLQAYESGRRIRLWYGDPDTGSAWPEEHQVTGYVHRSTGPRQIFILVHNRRSTGGGGILGRCIVRIDYTDTGETIYQHPDFDSGFWTIYQRGDDVIVGLNTYRHARFPDWDRARRYVHFMKGYRYNR